MVVLKFHKNRFSVDEITTSFLLKNTFLREATLLKEQQLLTKANNSDQRETNVRKWEQLGAKGNNYAAPYCDTSDSNHLVDFDI